MGGWRKRVIAGDIYQHLSEDIILLIVAWFESMSAHINKSFTTPTVAKIVTRDSFGVK